MQAFFGLSTCIQATSSVMKWGEPLDIPFSNVIMKLNENSPILFSFIL